MSDLDNGEIYRKIGKNLLGFQLIERILKYQAKIGNISYYVNDDNLEDILEKRAAKFDKQTMGQVAKQVLDNIFSEDTTSEYEESKGTRFSFRPFVEYSDNNYPDKRKGELDSIITERNDLVHHLFSKWKLNSPEGKLQLEQYLDQQYERICSEILFQLKFIISATKFSPDSEIYLNLAFLFLRLFEMSEQEDGWIVLDRALHIIRQESPQDIIELRKRFGKKLREMILPVDIFDIKNELTNKRGTRVLYRIKPELKCIKSNKIKISLTQIENRFIMVDLWMY